MDHSELRPIDVNIPEAPPIPGLRFRRPAGPADYAPMAAVHAACAEVDGLDEEVTAADMANFLENPIGSDPARDPLVAEIDGRLVAYLWMSHRRETAGDEVHQHRGYVVPAWRRHDRNGAGPPGVAPRRRTADGRARGRNGSIADLPARYGVGLAYVLPKARLLPGALCLSHAARSDDAHPGAADPAGPRAAAGAA
jgi:hypothetical protein